MAMIFSCDRRYQLGLGKFVYYEVLLLLFDKKLNRVNRVAFVVSPLVSPMIEKACSLCISERSLYC